MSLRMSAWQQCWALIIATHCLSTVVIWVALNRWWMENLGGGRQRNAYLGNHGERVYPGELQR